MQSGDARDERLPDEFKPEGSLTDRIARRLSERIVTGLLQPGTPVRQDHVALEFHASHVPVREAFRMLEAQGLLVSHPRRGVRVAPLDASTVQEVTEMRASLEVLALRHAFERFTTDDLTRAANALSEGEASQAIVVWERANRRFHDAITAPCGMPRLMATIEELHQASARFLFATWKDLGWQPRSDQEHIAILDRLRSGDLKTASHTLKRHILDAGHALMRSVARSAL
jgi:DNA-binding GntR family transcriptional regulator